jgi:hypothetical protein
MRAMVFGLALLVQGTAAREVTLVLPHPLSAGKNAWIEVRVGAIGHNEVDVTTAAGEEIGTISPFGLRFGQAAGSYTLPVPAGAIQDGKITIRLTIIQPSGAPRAPTMQEVPGVAIRP